MSACEKCWSKASMHAAMFGGVAADHYARILKENDAEHGSQEQTMNEPTLTDAEREALLDIAPYSCIPNEGDMQDTYEAVERIVAARVAEAVDRERAAWATKIEAWIADVERVGAGDLRALLAADDPEAKP